MTRWLPAIGGLTALFSVGCTTSIDAQTPRAYPCDHDGGAASQCPAGWRCGLEGYCHGDAGAPYLCQTSNDCEAAWHCGVQGICYDLADAGAVLCRVDAGDCAVGWRCGLNGTCHPTSVPGPYACSSDSDCEQGWRCGPDGICLDASGDGLRPAPPASAIAVGRLSPAWSGLPDEYAVGPLPAPAYSFSIPYETMTRIYTAVRDGGLVHVRENPNTNGAGAFVDAVTVPLRSPNVSSVAAVGAASYVLDDLGLWSFSIDVNDGGRTTASLPLLAAPSAVIRLRVTEESVDTYPPGTSCTASPPGPPGNLLIAVLDSGFEFWDAGTVALGASTALAAPPGVIINDIVGFWTPNSQCQQDLLAATSDGLFVADRGSGGAFVAAAGCPGGANPCFVPVNADPFLNAQCQGAATLVPLRLATHPLNGNTAYLHSHFPVAAQVANPDGGAGDFVSWFILGDPNFPSPITSCAAIGEPGSSINWTGACPACLPGETLVDFHPSDFFTVTTRCRSAVDGGFVENAREVEGSGGPCVFRGSSWDSAFLNGEETRPATSTAGAEYADTFGRQWHRELLGNPSAPLLSNVPLTLDRTPGMIVGSSATFLRARYGTPFGNISPTPLSSSFLLAPNIGMGAAGSNDINLCGGVSGAPLMLQTGALGPVAAVVVAPLVGVSRQGASRVGSVPPPPLAALTDSSAIAASTLPDSNGTYWSQCSAAQSTTVQGLVAPLPDGGTELLAFSTDTLWAGDITPLLQDGGYDGGTLPIDIRAVPLPRLTISAAIAVAPSASSGTWGDLLDGYLLIEGHLVRFRARTQTLWTTDELIPPAGQPIALWADGPRGRIAFADGTVDSLPSLVPIAHPLPATAQPASDYASVCGNGYALTPAGLFRLVEASDGGAVGDWVPVPLSPAMTASELARGLPGGRLYADPPRALVFSSVGTVAQVTDTTCP